MSDQAGALVIRQFQPADAQPVSDLFSQVYGAHYVYPEVYLPSLIAQRNVTGQWHSVVAEQQGVIVGHAALMIESPATWCAELALMVVSQVAIGRGIGIRLARLLCVKANELQVGMIIAMLVSSHVQTQRMAAPLGFFTTGLLLDYLPSPFAAGQRESYVLSCLPLQVRPLPDVVWPQDAWPWIKDALTHLGARTVTPLSGDVCQSAAPLDVRSDGELIVMTVSDTDSVSLTEAARLPPQRYRLVRLRISTGLAAAAAQLCRAGYRHAGLLPAADGNWYWLMQAGFSTSSLRLHCGRARDIFAAAHAHGPHA